jgi:gas vesicle protein
MATDTTDRTAYVALGMIFGVAAGVGAGMLLAPRSGQETRGKIRERALSAKEKANQQLGEKREMAMDKLNKTLDKSKTLVDKASEKTKDAVDKTAARATDAANQAQAETARRRAAS